MNPPIQEHKNLIESEAAKYTSRLPKHYVEAEAYSIAHEAAKSFDPKSGNKFSTHLHNQLKQLSRLSTEHGSIVRMPENKQFALNKVNKFVEDYKGEHGREPSVDEISTATHLPISKVNALLKGKKMHTTLSQAVNEPTFVDEQSELDDWIHMVYHDLPQQDKHIFEHYTGFGGKKPIDEHAIAKKLNITAPLVKKRMKIIGEQIAKGLQ